MRSRRYSDIWLAPATCCITAVFGGLTGILRWLFVIAYLYVAALIGGYLAVCVVRATRNRLDLGQRKMLLLLPASAFVIYFYLFLWPWTSLPLAFGSFARLAPGDRPTAAILRALLCLGALSVTTHLTRRIVVYRAKPVTRTGK